MVHHELNEQWPIADVPGHFLAGTIYSEILAGRLPPGISLPDGLDLTVTYPWDLLRLNEALVATLTASQIRGTLSPAAHVDGFLHLGEGSTVLPGVYIEGCVMIGRNCKIGPNCYLRGHTAIGDHCRIGQAVEIKNSVIGHRTNVGHLSYVGDSILGHGVNFGAGTTTANLRHDGKTMGSRVRGIIKDTGRRKLGTIVGDHVHTGINTSIYPARKLGPNTSTLPGTIVRKDVVK